MFVFLVNLPYLFSIITDFQNRSFQNFRLGL